MIFTLSERLGRTGLSWFSWLCLVGLLLFLPTGWVSAWAWERDIRWFYILLIAFFSSTVLTPISIAAATTLNVLDMPDPRKVHAVPMPRLGGLAVYGAVVLTLVRNGQWSVPLAGLLAGGTIIYLMGVVDDARGLSARVRLLGQLAASGIVVASGLHITYFSVYVGTHVGAVLVTVLWLIGLTNAINFLDGIDGLAASLGVVCSLLFLAIAWPERQGSLAYACAALAGACLGFLPYNWNGAKTFLGDGGATFIGFMLAGLAIHGSWARNNPVVSLSTPLLILSIPIFDMVYTTISRIKNGTVTNFREWLEYAGKDHFHHRLMKIGMRPPEAVGFILMLQLALGLNALICHFSLNPMTPLLILTQTAILYMIVVVLMLIGRQLT
ncbi:MAG: undecaprenyl/decaprenyl-phosphate alpha-N-acetylglucosaminyl 1-phosphate transferase [Elusimicrobia bacterium]|nr:undecaprenyl/decaprenyl-phosphate alpha-N-acetylglucosaminyl 1-phosphate transferase [Elusimicrobiota bacterium]